MHGPVGSKIGAEIALMLRSKASRMVAFPAVCVSLRSCRRHPLRFKSYFSELDSVPRKWALLIAVSTVPSATASSMNAFR